MKLTRRLFATVALGLILAFPTVRMASHVDPLLSVAYVTNKEGTSGGTGFHVKAPSGKMYLVTNGHVCKGVEKDGVVYVRLGEGDTSVPRNVIQESPSTDLCLVEPLPQARAVKLSEKDPESGDILAAIGHPRLFQITKTQGITIGPRKVEFIQSFNPEPGTCDEPKNVRKEITLLFWKIPACLVAVDAIQTTITILPGSSGSPIFDEQFRVKGIAFASDESAWAAIVPVTQLNTFLRHY